MQSNHYRFVNQIIFLVLCVAGVATAETSKPLWTLTPIPSSKTTQTVPETSNASVQYTVQNQSNRAKQLVILPILGIKQTALCQLAPKGHPGSSCTLNLIVTGSALPEDGIHDGPALCQANPNGSPNPNQCYRPSAEHILHISKSKVPPISNVTIAAPSTLTFVVSETGTITVSNTSGSASVMNLQVTIPPGSQLFMHNSSTCTIGGSIPAASSCTVVLTTAANVSTENGTVITIKGDNSNTVMVSVSTILTTLALTSPTTIQTLEADGVTTLSISVKNTGNANADNVQITLASSWFNVTPSPASCGTIPAQGTCNFDISSTTPNIAGQISIQGSDTNAVTTPFITFTSNGYLIFSTTGAPPGTAKVIDVADDSPQIKWDSSFLCSGGTCQETNATSPTNGAYLDNTGNTFLIISGSNAIGTQGGSGGNAAAVCYNIINDNTGAVASGTWYLPAICEMWSTGPFASDCPGVNDIFNNLVLPGFGAPAFGNISTTDAYWSSTEGGAIAAWVQVFSIPGEQFTNDKGADVDLFNNLPIRVRCVREFNY